MLRSSQSATTLYSAAVLRRNERLHTAYAGIRSASVLISSAINSRTTCIARRGRRSGSRDKSRRTRSATAAGTCGAGSYVGRIAAQLRLGELFERLDAKGRPAREQLEQHRAQAIQVAAFIGPRRRGEQLRRR